MATSKKRPYNSEKRKKQSQETREKIIKAGVSIAHELPSWDWKSLTFKAVSERANISERTVYRHFPSEKILKDAVIEKLTKESGISIESLTLADFNPTVKSLFLYIQSFSAKAEDSQDPTFSAVDEERRNALVYAVTDAAPNWNEDQKKMVSAALDLLWQPSTYNRLVDNWGFNSKQSLETLSWLINLIENSVQNNQPPHIK